MNKYIFFRNTLSSFFTLLIFSCYCYAQNSVTLVFTGKDQHDSHVKMNGITIHNINRKWQETILFPDTVYTLNIGTGIDDIQAANEMKVMPNPFSGQTRVNIFSTKDEDAKMLIVDINGRKHADYAGKLTSGDNYFDITLTTPQTYILSIQTQSGIRSLKMINTGHGGANKISFVSNSPKAVKVSIKSSSSHDFELGDEMRYTGFAQIDNHIMQSVPVQQVQFSSEEISLRFEGYQIETSTDSVLVVDDTTFICYGTVHTYGSGAVQTGFCWDNEPNPTLANNHISSGISALMAKNHRATQVLGVGVSPLGTTDVRRSDDQVLKIHGLDIRQEDCRSIQMIDRHIEEALDLVGMEIHRDQAVDAGNCQHVRNQLSADSHTRLVLTVLTRPAEIRDYSDDLISGSPLGRINHQEQLHQIVCAWHSRLNQENIMAAHRLLIGDPELTICKSLQIDFT